MQTLPGFNIMYESSVVIPSTLLEQQSKVKMKSSALLPSNLPRVFAAR